MNKLIMILILIISVSLYCSQAFSKQYNVSSYYKVVYIGDKECYNYYSYYDGKEHFLYSVCK